MFKVQTFEVGSPHWKISSLQFCDSASLWESLRIYFVPFGYLRPMLRGLDLIKPLGVISQHGAFVGIRDRRFGDLVDLVQDIVGADFVGEIAGK